ncbi:MAG: hypothetical protein EBS85_01770 [Micrococcales bacterium]|nr:hypothetical protein [Actinomycetota bacterium]NCA07447.1 hypothetical protein [Micrococcales bacterium]
MGFMRKEWLPIASVWLLVAIGAILVILNMDRGESIRGFGVLAAGSIALVSLVHLFSSHSEGIVRRLIFAAGGAYAILALAGLYILLLG